MKCQCADRMRKWVLPAADYRLEGTTWVSSRANYAPIPDTEVEQHHARLTTALAYQMGLDAFKNWWGTVTGTYVSEALAREYFEEGVRRNRASYDL